MMHFLRSKRSIDKPDAQAQTSPTALEIQEPKSEKITIPQNVPQSKDGIGEQIAENGDAQSPPIVEDHYAHGVKLATITICVALSVLLVALVSIISSPSFNMSQ